MNIVNEQDESLIFLTLDLGASISKALYTIDKFENLSMQRTTSETHIMYMSSEMIKLPQKMLEPENVSNLVGTPEDAAWIRLSSKDTNVTLFGLLAKKFQAMKQNQIHSVKYENALDKCLAFIGAIIKKHNLNPLRVKVNLNLLIPYDEFKSGEVIKRNIHKSIKSFYFQDLVIRAKLDEFDCFPEGFGGFIYRVDFKGQEWLKDKKIAVVMLGHRNSSCLIFERGSLLSGETIRAGYFDFIKDIQNNSIGQKLEDLEFLIPRIKKVSSESDRILNSLIKANKKQNQNTELKSIKNAINLSKEKFWNRLSNWLDYQIPSYLNEIMIFGGASNYFQEEFQKSYHWSNIYWGDDTINELKQLSFTELEHEQNLPHRFIDVFGLHQHVSKIK